MTVDQAISAWESMLADANATEPADRPPTTIRGHAAGALRTAVLLILAAVAILVLLPAALAAQGVLPG